MTEALVRKKPGMASVKDMPILQDGPPPGGFAPVRYARRIPTKGPSAVAIFLAAFGTFAWGMYQVGKGNKIRRELKEEKYAARRAILPMLQAEEDERFVGEWKKYLEEEARIMKDVPGWKVGENVYNSGKWMPPATGELRPEVWRDLGFLLTFASLVEIQSRYASVRDAEPPGFSYWHLVDVALIPLIVLVLKSYWEVQLVEAY
ncbi:hypothetical protein J5N97_023417 [Dioscorea zingiberensis]|uniref:NADH dehydrogenase [ubiquinone] 1 alpha subcomplex subunit 13 n=1 Tax=Dioscorea zingiberensis TaxID=325984 RepID=A0A9D5C4L3_9LILI|nr:hypothetical protein J5N97_023417 [Dioscorea zingiberensis]